MINKIHTVIFFAFLSKTVLACDCPKGTTLEQDFSTSKFISYGTINKIEQDSSKPDYESYFGEFHEIEVFKGPAYTVKTVRGGAHTSGASCTKKLEPGEYIIFANKSTDFVSLCSLSKNISKFPKEEKNSMLESLRHLSQSSKKS